MNNPLICHSVLSPTLCGHLCTGMCGNIFLQSGAIIVPWSLNPLLILLLCLSVVSLEQYGVLVLNFRTFPTYFTLACFTPIQTIMTGAAQSWLVFPPSATRPIAISQEAQLPCFPSHLSALSSVALINHTQLEGEQTNHLRGSYDDHVPVTSIPGNHKCWIVTVPVRKSWLCWSCDSGAEGAP